MPKICKKYAKICKISHFMQIMPLICKICTTDFADGDAFRVKVYSADVGGNAAAAAEAGLQRPPARTPGRSGGPDLDSRDSTRVGPGLAQGLAGPDGLSFQAVSVPQ